MKKSTAGIYKITSPSGKVYIGQSWNIQRRWIYYKYNYEYSRQFPLMNSILKYGYKSHNFEVVHELPADVEQSVMDRYEQFYMDTYREAGIKLLNCKEAGSNGKPSAEAIQRQIAGQTGKKRSQETKNRISFSNTGVPFTQERKDNIGKANTGKVPTQQHRDKISATSKGHKKPPHHGYNVSRATRGVPKSEAHRKALSESRIAKGTASGTKNPKAKLNEVIVKEIRVKFATGIRVPQLCIEYNMSRSGMYSIVNGQNWPNV